MATESAGAPAPERAPRVMLALLILLALGVALFAVATAAGEPGRVSTWVDPVLYDITFLLAGALICLRAATGGSRTRPWFLVGGGLLVYVVGRIIFVSGEPVPITERTVTTGDVFWLLFYPVAFVALLVLTKRHLSMRITYSLLDSILVGAGAFAVGVAVLDAWLLPTTSQADHGFVLLTSLSLVFDLVILVLVLTMAQAFDWRPPLTLWFLIAGASVFCVAIAVYLVQVVQGVYVAGTWVDVLWPVTALLIATGAYLDRERYAAPAVPQRLTFLAPGAAILAAGFVLIWSPPGPLQSVAIASAAVTIVLAVVRLNLDVQQSLRLTRQLRRARVDSLTGLPNRRSLIDLDVSGRGRCSAVLIDLDAFRDINNTMGHEAGDRVLVMVAQRLVDGVGADDLVLRLEGDEFGVVLWGADAPGAVRIAETLVRSLERPVTVEGVPLLVTACAGVVESADDRPEPEAMLRQAAGALAEAKADGPGLVRAQALDPGEQTAHRLRMRAEARRALDAGGADFVIHYQPIVSLLDGSLLSVEALVRWQFEGTLLQPSDFLQETIRGGQMADLTRLMIGRSVREVHGAGLDLPVHVNVPPELLTDWILAACDSALVGVRRGGLVIEITEEALMRRPEAVAVILAALRERGVPVLLDDFGTGWSGLSTLRNLIVDGIKIDHSFVSLMATDRSTRAIVRSVATLAAGLDLLVVYEGSDDASVLADLPHIGRAYVQSYAIARPMPIGALREWVAGRRADSPS